MTDKRIVMPDGSPARVEFVTCANSVCKGNQKFFMHQVVAVRRGGTKEAPAADFSLNIVDGAFECIVCGSVSYASQLKGGSSAQPPAGPLPEVSGTPAP